MPPGTVLRSFTGKIAMSDRMSQKQVRRQKLLSRLAAVFWGVMLGLRARQAIAGDWMAMLLALQAALVAFRLVDRRLPVSEASPGWRVFAWTDALLPAAYVSAGSELISIRLGEILAAAGIFISLWAILSLGNAFGIAPADRGLVSRGPYQLIRHPAYAGELLNFLAYGLTHRNTWNTVLTLILIAAMVARILVEERQIEGYPEYAQRVRWRVLYGVW